MNFIWFIVIGGIAGWLSGRVIKGSGFGVPGNIIVGIIGSIVGGWVFNFFNISTSGKTIGPFITAFCGALIVLFIVGKLSKK